MVISVWRNDRLILAHLTWRSGFHVRGMGTSNTNHTALYDASYANTDGGTFGSLIDVTVGVIQAFGRLQCIGRRSGEVWEIEATLCSGQRKIVRRGTTAERDAH